MWVQLMSVLEGGERVTYHTHEDGKTRVFQDTLTEVKSISKTKAFPSSWEK
jgi:hypothetical protein